MTTIADHATRTLTVPELSLQERAIRLAELARDIITGFRADDFDTAVLVCALAAPGMDPVRRSVLWGEYAEAVRLETDVESGFVTWSQVADAPGADEALDDVRRAAVDALHALVHGGEI